MEFSEPKRIGKSKLYTQCAWDEEKKKGYLIMLMKKPDGTFETKSKAYVNDLFNKVLDAPTLQTPIKID